MHAFVECSYVVVLGGPKGHAYRVDFEPQNSYESMQASVLIPILPPYPNLIASL